MTRNQPSEYRYPDPAPTVTVIVPVYDAEPYLGECLDSIAGQTFSDFEVIMINDGSTDGSRSICERFASSDPRFQLLNLPNGGVSAARNAGIDRARGRYICFVDADDTIHPNYISRLTASMADNDADVVIARYAYGDSPSALCDRQTEPLLFDPVNITELGLYQKICVNAAGGTMISRHIIENGLRYNTGRRYEDLDIFYKFLLRARKVAYIPDRLYFYRHNDSSFLNTFSEGRLDALEVTDDIVDYMRSHAPQLVRAARDRRFSAHFNVLLLLLKYDADRPATVSRCMSVIKAERLNELLNPKVKLKNKLGALASYGGPGFLTFLNRLTGACSRFKNILTRRS